MKLPLRILAGCVALFTGLGASAAEKTGQAGPWITDFQRYAAQKNLQVESSYSSRPRDAKTPTLGGLLRALPAPAEWPQLRRALGEAAAKAPAGVEQQRLQAGGWLLAYLLGDRAAVLAELPPAEPRPTTRVAYAAGALRTSLGNTEAPEQSREQELESFEQQLQAVEPVDLAEVKRTLGGEENFARLHRLLAAGKVMNEKMGAIYEEYEKTKDKTAAAAKMEALGREFAEQHGKDQEALEPYMEKPLIGRYIMGLYQEQGDREEYEREITVPDLVKLAGRERAEVLLRRALRLPVTLSLIDESGTATGQLARELALAEIANLKRPAWGLVRDVQAGALFEALLQRFPVTDPKKEHNEQFQAACGYYLVGLIQEGRTKDAVTFASRPGVGTDLRLPYEVMEALEKSGQAAELWEFLKDWLGKFPAASEWDRFNRLSAQLGRQNELKALIKAMAANGAFAGLDRLRVQEMQADAELATDDLAAAEERLRALLVPLGASVEERTSQFEIAVKLLQLADLRADAPGFTRALAAAEALLEKSWQDGPSAAVSGTVKLITALNSLGHLTESAPHGRRALERIAAAKLKGGEEPSEWRYMSDYELKNLLGEQLRTAVELGRWPEALALVQESTAWNTQDVSGLLGDTLTSNRRPVGLYMGQVALHEKDQSRARRIFEAQLVATPGSDAVYAAYLGLVKQDAQPLLEKLVAADRYEERPLIWQARLQLDAKKWDAAVATLQQAISVDPSDGEQGRGDRMRVYAFMAEAMKGQGNAEKAKFFEDVVKSIRLSETADRWFEIGAYAHAITLYRQALGFFQDAYCIQSRLAVRLAHEGRIDEAAEHYRRAFELMPDSFGRVESHCFGCEHVFAGEKSQGVAEKVFTTMLAARPDKPQLHYLMGYLRQEQERPAEAAEHFRKAVQLDPLYLNAWDKLGDLESKLHFTPLQRDDLQLKLLELDPTRRHVSPNLRDVTDVARLWTAMGEAQRIVAALPAAGPLWELKASAAELAKKPAGRDRGIHRRGRMTSPQSCWNTTLCKRCRTIWPA